MTARHDPATTARHGPAVPSPFRTPRTVLLDLDDDGVLLHPDSGRRVPDDDLPFVMRTTLSLSSAVSDIVVFVHGWNTSPKKAVARTDRLVDLATAQWAAHRALYPALPRGLRLHPVALRWHSRVRYGKARARTRDTTLEGHAAHVVAALLGYLDQRRKRPSPGHSLQTQGGQFLHCVGHSFGCRFLAQAIPESGPAALSRRPSHVLARARRDPRYPYTVDSVLLFQMAAPPAVFGPGGAYAPLLTDAPVSGPVALTHTRHDRATGLWHLLREGRRGIGTVGLRGPAVIPVHHTLLRSPELPYVKEDLAHCLVDVDASKVFGGGFWTFPGSHSDLWHHQHSAHLLLSLMDRAHEAGCER